MKKILSCFRGSTPPEHITLYSNSLQKQHIKSKIRKTKHGEWVVISRERETDEFIYIWLSTFMRRKLHKRMPMYLKIESKGASIKIMDINVSVEDANKGYGSALMDELFEVIEERKVKKITGLAERPEDPRLVGFYEKYGIVIVKSQLKWER